MVSETQCVLYCFPIQWFESWIARLDASRMGLAEFVCNKLMNSLHYIHSELFGKNFEDIQMCSCQLTIKSPHSWGVSTRGRGWI